MIKFGWRYSLLYPSLFILFIFLRRVVKFILETFVAVGLSFPYLFVLLMVIFEIIIGTIYLCINKRKNDSSGSSRFMGINLVQNNEIFERPDSNFKIILLIFLASYFQFVGALSRRAIKNENDKTIYDEFHANFRSCEIIISSLLCYFTLHLKIFRHHLLSLIIILFCLILVLSSTLISTDGKSEFYQKAMNIIITLISSLCRAYLDTIEKYLFTIDFIDVFKLIICEGIIDIILMPFLYIMDTPKKEITDLFEIDEFNLILAIVLLLIYGVLSSLKNVYRRFTVKEFTPMTRALAESILDPIFIIYGFYRSDSKNYVIFIITLICSLIMVFCSCIYNEIFVLFCCGLELNTHLGIVKNTKEFELANDSIDDN